MKEFLFPAFPNRPLSRYSHASNDQRGDLGAATQPRPKSPRKQPGTGVAEERHSHQNNTPSLSRQLSQLQKQLDVLERESKETKGNLRRSKSVLLGSRGVLLEKAPSHQAIISSGANYEMIFDSHNFDSMSLNETIAVLKSKYIQLEKSKRDEISAKTKENDKLAEERDDLKSQLRSAQEALKNATEHLSKLNNVRSDLKVEADNEYQQAKGNILVLEAKLTASQALSSSLREEVAELHRELIRERQRVTEVQDQIDSEKRLSLELETRVRTFLSDEKNGKIAMIITGFESNLDSLKTQCSTLENEKSQLHLQVKQLSTTNSTLVQSVENLQKELSKEQQATTEWLGKAQKAEMEISRLQKELAQVRQNVFGWENELEKKRAQAEAVLQEEVMRISQSAINISKNKAAQSNSNLVKKNVNAESEYVDDFEPRSFTEIYESALKADPEFFALYVKLVKQQIYTESLKKRLDQTLKEVVSTEYTNKSQSVEIENLVKIIGSLKRKCTQLENEKMELFEKNRICEASNEYLTTLNGKLDKDVQALREFENKFLQEHQKVLELRRTNTDLTEALLKMKEWKIALEENERVAKEVAQYMRSFAQNEDQRNLHGKDEKTSEESEQSF